MTNIRGDISKWFFHTIMDDHLNCVVFINIEYLISKISCINTLLQEIDTLIAVAIAILLHTQLSDSGILQFLKNCNDYHQVIYLYSYLWISLVLKDANWPTTVYFIQGENIFSSQTWLLLVSEIKLSKSCIRNRSKLIPVLKMCC